MNSTAVTNCAICGHAELEPVLNVGYLPPVNTLQKIGERLVEQPFFPTELLHCRQCSLVQLGCQVEPSVLFPYEYAYRSRTTKALRENFADLAREVVDLNYAKAGDLVIDVGCNDGTLLDYFKGAGLRTFGVEPTRAAVEARAKGHSVAPTLLRADLVDFWLRELKVRGPAKVVTACNVFAHIPEIHDVIECVKGLLADDGVFVIEVQDVQKLQYDTVYHEHLFYYSLVSLTALLERHDMTIVRYRRINTHGGSIRAYFKRKGCPDAGFGGICDIILDVGSLAKKVMRQKLELLTLMAEIKRSGHPVYGIGCPSRAVTLIHYVGLDGVLDCVCEVADSPKVGHYVPGTRIPIVDEAQLYADQPRYALLLSWHLADSLIPKIRERGFCGQFILPLPTPRIV